MNFPVTFIFPFFSHLSKFIAVTSKVDGVFILFSGKEKSITFPKSGLFFVSSIASSVNLGLASSFVNSEHPPISSLFVETVKFSGATVSFDSKETTQSKSPWTGVSEVVTASLKVQFASFSTFSPFITTKTFIGIVWGTFKLALTKAAKKKLNPLGIVLMWETCLKEILTFSFSSALAINPFLHFIPS